MSDALDQPSLLDSYIQQTVILDTKNHYLYLGKLGKIDRHFIQLQDADVHDLNASRTSKEFYLIEAKRHGVNASRKEVLIFRHDVISFSKLDDVLEF